MRDPVWRISNLYKIVDKYGNVVTFRPNDAQADLLRNLSRRDIILKARQLGITTLICIIGLDEALFQNNWSVGIIAHNEKDMNKIFETKIKFPYDNLPEEIRAAIPAITDRAGALSFAHGSSISVALSFRSGTLQRLHVSEYGKICAKTPDKAKEIKTGAFPAAAEGAITIESTAEGQEGDFFEMTQRAMAVKTHGPRDFRFHFYPWHGAAEYTLHDIGMVLTEENKDYFAKIEHESGIVLTHAQKCWYQAEALVQGAEMKREYPSTPREAFEQALEGAYFERQLAHLDAIGAIDRYPHDPRYDVNTFWDLGRNDLNAIWMHQYIGGRNRFIGYYEASGEHILHYIHWLKAWGKPLGVVWGDHYWPHDGARQDEFLEAGRLGVVEEFGFRPMIVPRVSNKLTAIEACRTVLPTCDFDAQGCAVGLKRLKHYRKEWDDRRGVWKDRPRHDDNSNGADAFQTFAMGFEPPDTGKYEYDSYDFTENRATEGISNVTGY